MHSIREVLRLHFGLGLSRRQVAKSLAVSRDGVATTIERATEAGLTVWPLPDDLSDTALEQKLYPPREPTFEGELLQRPEPDWEHVHSELRGPNVTLRLLWEEYRAEQPDGIRYSWYCERYRAWAKHVDPVMRIAHVAGEKMFVDYAGDTIGVIDRATGEIREAHLFVATLGASSYTYAEVTWTEALPDWVMAHVRAIHFFGGATKLIVPDNAAVAVKRPCYYEPTINRTYAEMAAHYGMAVLPTRVKHPKDKPKVESAVGHAERRILARLRNRQFFSLTALNEAIAELLVELNEAPFQKMEGSRKLFFEALDRPALAPLPPVEYEYAEWLVRRAGVDYHVDVDRHFYSVPHTLIRRKLDVRVTARTVEVFYRNERVASHLRSHRRHGHTTVAEHMPSSHRRYAGMSPERIRAWAAGIGEATAAVCDRILAEKPHPEHGYRACMGIRRLAERYGAQRTEAACRRALAAGAVRYRSIQSILARGLDQMPLFAATEPDPLPNHEHIRGPSYYN
jgi:transposase